MDTPIITIGREYGAGGHTVARIIAQRLGIPAYDKEIIKLTAEESGLNEAVLQSTEESDGLRKLISWFLPSGAVSTYDQAILAQAQVIRNIAAQGPCVIVGRGADYILRDLPNVVNVFLYANREDKLRYAMDTYGDSPEQAARRVRQSDAARESYYHYLTKKKWGDLKNYHLSLNTSPVGKAACAALILQYAQRAAEGERTALP